MGRLLEVHLHGGDGCPQPQVQGNKEQKEQQVAFWKAQGVPEGIRVGVGLLGLRIVGGKEVQGGPGPADVPLVGPSRAGVQLQQLLGRLLLRLLLPLGGTHPVPAVGVGLVPAEFDPGQGEQVLLNAVHQKPLPGHLLQPGLKAGKVHGVYRGPLGDPILLFPHRSSLLIFNLIFTGNVFPKRRAWDAVARCALHIAAAYGRTLWDKTSWAGRGLAPAACHSSGVSMAAISSYQSVRSSAPEYRRASTRSPSRATTSQFSPARRTRNSSAPGTVSRWKVSWSGR